MIIIEGIDGAGKSTVCAELAIMGYTIHHLQYNEKNEEGSLNLLRKCNEFFVLDRSFITEMVYGPILRKKSRISDIQAENIIKQYSLNDCKIIYLKALKNDLLIRRKSSLEDYDMIANYYERIVESYEEVLDYVSKQIPTYVIDSSENDAEMVMKKVKRIIGGFNDKRKI